MNKIIGAIVPLCFALVSSQAVARTFVTPQTVCQPTSGFTGCINYDQFGAHNTCGVVATVECPLPISYPVATPTVNTVGVFSYDRSTTTNVSCTLQRTDFAGNVLYTSTQSTAGGGPGTGVQTNTFSPAVSASGYWRLRCSVPAVNAGNFSHISNVYVQTSE